MDTVSKAMEFPKTLPKDARDGIDENTIVACI